MKIIISGKGGSGKSTVSALLANALKNRDFGILLVNADESNEGLHRHLGISCPVPLLHSLGGKKGFKKNDCGYISSNRSYNSFYR